MEIITRFRIPGSNGRTYVFPFNFEKTYGDVKNAVEHMDRLSYGSAFKEVRDKKFAIIHSIMWGDDDGNKMVDFFGIQPNNIQTGWEQNPMYYTWVMKNGIIIPKKNLDEITCSNGMMIIGEEEKHRRKFETISEYLRNPPEIKDLVFRNKDLDNSFGKESVYYWCTRRKP